MIEIIGRPELGKYFLGLKPGDKAAMLVVNTTEQQQIVFLTFWLFKLWSG